MKRTIITGTVAIAVVALLAVPKLVSSDNGGLVGGGRTQDTLQVAAHVVQPQPLRNTIYTTGSVRANEAVDLVSEASGKLTRILFSEGSRVQQGQLLVKINDAELQAQLVRAQHRLALAQKREARQRQILEKGGVSQEEYDLALNEVNVLEAEVSVIEAQVEKTEIHAPFSGVIGLRYVSEGSYISPQSRIATLQNLDPIKIDFSVPEKYAGQVRPGQAIQFRIAGTEQVFRGEIYAVEPRIEQDTRTLQLRARSQNPGNVLVPGAFADVEMILSEIPDAVTVPSIAVVPELNGQKVYVYRSGLAASQPVQTGIRTDTQVQVLSGLAPGDTVLTSGLQQVRPGLPVDVQLD